MKTLMFLFALLIFSGLAIQALDLQNDVGKTELIEKPAIGSVHAAFAVQKDYPIPIEFSESLTFKIAKDKNVEQPGEYVLMPGQDKKVSKRARDGLIRGKEFLYLT